MRREVKPEHCDFCNSMMRVDYTDYECPIPTPSGHKVVVPRVAIQVCSTCDHSFMSPEEEIRIDAWEECSGIIKKFV